jgi:16S rRNA pseudouridine516 synthase
MRLAQILFSQGFGTRRECAGLIYSEMVQVDGRVADDPDADFPTEGFTFSVRGEPWRFFDKALVLLHKPAGYECSMKPKHHPSVMSLLPTPLRTRGLQPVGRLDEDTTGFLLLTDDGTLLHKLTSPKHHVPKVYEVALKHPVDDTQVRRLLEGVVLDDDPAPVRAASCEATGERSIRLTLTEGKYHQVKRMCAAVSNRVEGLHRSAMGSLTLDGLAPGKWRWVEAQEREALGLKAG